MSALTVAKKDFLGARRSRALWAVATLLSLLAALIAFGYQGYQLTPTESVRHVFDVLAMVLALLLPIVALVASYMSIAGERESGGVKFLLAFPNTRRDVFVGKLASRLAVIGAGVCLLFAAAASVAAARHAALPVGVVVGLLLVSLAYSSVFVAIAVALSASVAARSRAIGAAVASYFVLVILYVVPGVRLTAVVRWLHHTILGLDRNLDLYAAATYASPYVAFQKATNLVFPANLQSQAFRRTGEAGADLPVYLTDEFSLVVFAAWIVVPLAVGYRRFERTDLE